MTSPRARYRHASSQQTGCGRQFAFLSAHSPRLSSMRIAPVMLGSRSAIARGSLSTRSVAVCDVFLFLTIVFSRANWSRADFAAARSRLTFFVLSRLFGRQMAELVRGRRTPCTACSWSDRNSVPEVRDSLAQALSARWISQQQRVGSGFRPRRCGINPARVLSRLSPTATEPMLTCHEHHESRRQQQDLASGPPPAFDVMRHGKRGGEREFQGIRPCPQIGKRESPPANAPSDIKVPAVCIGYFAQFGGWPARYWVFSRWI